MKRFLSLVTLFICFSTSIYGQSSVPSMILIQNGTINYDYYKDTKQGRRTTDFHISRYAEANYQYQQYLTYLTANSLDSLLELAQPNRQIWEEVDISTEDIAHLKTHYWTHSDFASYPVLGLTYQQILNYFKWKTERITYAFLLKNRKLRSKKVAYQPFSIKNI